VFSHFILNGFDAIFFTSILLLSRPDFSVLTIVFLRNNEKKIIFGRFSETIPSINA
jgi:hypothetical protein